MSVEKIDKLFKWIDIIKLVLGGIVAGAIAMATWATRIQIQTNENKDDIENSQKNVQAHRDSTSQKELLEERRLARLEEAVEWLKSEKAQH
jgi:hypothetical protein